MDDIRLGSALRAVRLRRHLTQDAVARSAHVNRWQVSLVESGRLEDLPVRVLRRIARALDVQCDISFRWRGPELDMILNRAHASLQVAVLRVLETLEGWEVAPEVTYSFYGERGAIDILAWHPTTGSLLVIELKTYLADPAELTRKMDERLRNAERIAALRGWRPRTVSSWVILTETRTNRGRVARYREILAPLLGLDGRTMRRWLREPVGAVSALSFWTAPEAVVSRRVGTHRGPSAR
jgi:transcriptional regulator with XRE-family HTH domain